MNMKSILLLSLLFSVFACAAFTPTRLMSSSSSSFVVSDLVQSPDRVFPGDSVNLKLSFSTTKPSASSVLVTANVPFLTTSSTFSFGEIAKGEKRILSLAFTVPEDTKAGTYSIYLYAQDSVTPQQEVAKVQFIVNEPSLSGLLIASASYENAVNTGDTVPITILLNNTGLLDAEDVTVELNKSDVFTPLQYDRKYVEKVGAGKSVEIPFTVGVDATASSGFYALIVNIRYNVDKVLQPSIQQDLGIKVEAVAQILVTADVQRSQTGSVVSLSIANVGDTAVRGVYIVASSDDFRISGSSKKFIGTLNLDDSSTMSLDLTPLPRASEEPSVKVTMSYKDPLNQEHVIEQQVPVVFGAGPQQSSAPSSSVSGQPASGQLPDATASQRFVRNRAQGFLGLDLIQWGAIIVVLAIAGFFAYRHFKGGRKK